MKFKLEAWLIEHKKDMGGNISRANAAKARKRHDGSFADSYESRFGHRSTEIQQWSNQGKPAKWIAQQLGVKYYSVYHIFNKLNIQFERKTK